MHFRNEMEVGPGGRQIQVEDPDGNPIELFEPAAEVDPHYPVSVGIESNISMALDELAKRVNSKGSLKKENRNIQNLLKEELEEGAQSDSFPVKPQRIVSDIDDLSSVAGNDVILDTGEISHSCS